MRLPAPMPLERILRGQEALQKEARQQAATTERQQDELRKRYKEMVPARRFGTPEEVAYAVRCVAAREASYISGTILEVSGGL